MWFRSRTAPPDRQSDQLAASTSPRFHRAVQESGLVLDDMQVAAVSRLRTTAARGFYMWGTVGRGKSMLADLYYTAVPTTRKRRFHFHSFFRELQTEIAVTRQPVEKSIGSIIGPARMVFFDEFHVHDVADAIYLSKTLDALVERDILVLATSNYAPQSLMPNPLFHDRFVPAITLIESRLEIVPLGLGPDYRGRAADQGHTGFGAGLWSIDSATPTVSPESTDVVAVNGLSVRAVSTENSTATFTFSQLCERPLGVREYLKIAEDFDGIRLIAVPDLAAAERDPLMRLSNLVGVLYDRDQQLDVYASAGPERMLDAAEPPYDVARTLSRLAALQVSAPG